MSRLDAVESEKTRRFSPQYKAWVLFLIFLMMASNYIDRSIMRILAQPIKEEFSLSDFQVGLLGGLAFAVLYMVMGLPIARIADRTSRVNVMSAAIAVWSVMTALCGVAGSYSQLLLCRIGVGIGEAGALPPSQSLISDYFPPHQRASAISVNSFGVAIGGLAGLAVGGLAAEAWGWRAALLLVGVPGLLLALVFRLTVIEPARGGMDPEGAASAATQPHPSLLSVAKRLFRNATFVHLMLGASISNFAIQGIHLFELPYFARQFGLGLGTLGAVSGIVSGLTMGIGMVAGGLATDWASRRDRRWYVWLPAIGLVIAAPIYALVFVQATWTATVIWLALPGLLLYLWHAPAQAVIQNICPPNMRATAIALYIMCTAAIGLGLGPAIVGLVADMFATNAFSAAGDFLLACPGGVAPAGSDDVLSEACRSASATGARSAMMSVTILFLWSASHFLLAARTIRRDMQTTEVVH